MQWDEIQQVGMQGDGISEMGCSGMGAAGWDQCNGMQRDGSSRMRCSGTQHSTTGGSGWDTGDRVQGRSQAPTGASPALLGAASGAGPSSHSSPGTNAQQTGLFTSDKLLFIKEEHS